MATSNNPYNFPALHQDQPSFNQNYMQQPMTSPEDITDLTTAMNMALALTAKAFKLNYSTPKNNNQRISSNLRNRQIAQPGNANQYLNGNGNLVAARAEGNAAGHNGNHIRCYNCRGVGHFARNYTVRPRRRDVAYLQTQLLIAQKEEAGIQLQAEEFDLMAAATDLDEIKEVNSNCILMANLQQASTSGTQTDKALVYDSDGSAEFCDSDLEVAFRRNACFDRNIEGVDLLKGDRSTNLYTINLHEMASASPICLMARASSTKSWLWNQHVSHLNFDTINDLAKNNLVSGLPKFKYHKEHLCPSCELGKSKRASHPPKPIPNSRQRRLYFPPTYTIPRRSRKQTTNVVEPEFRTIVEMADNRTMAQMLQAPIEGYEDAIVVPQINANNFELKQTLINLVQSNQFTDIQDPHNHLHFFNKVTSTFRHPEVPNTTIKLLLFPFLLEGEA
nr:retrovirus-related Pol polyprotein from transposon TNT 1-94 [Tanacetum cinerariifolium]